MQWAHDATRVFESFYDISFAGLLFGGFHNILYDKITPKILLLQPRLM